MQFIEPHARNPSKIGLSGAAWTIQTRLLHSYKRL